MRKNHAKHQVAMAVQPGAPIFELSVPCEIFGHPRPEIHDPWYEFIVCPTQPAAEVAAGFVASQRGSMDDLASADTVIANGCENIKVQPPKNLIDALVEASGRGARIVGICSGAFVLAHAGLLDRRRATTHWMHVEDFAARFPTVEVDPSVLYVEDRGVFTSAGTAAAIDLCLELVGKTSAPRPRTKSRDAWSFHRIERAARPSTSAGRCRLTPILIFAKPSNGYRPT